MGLDVIFVREDGSRISWDNPIMQKQNGFPFERYGIDIPETINEYHEIVDVAYTQWCIAEICGMTCLGSVSFRGRGYSGFAGEELPYSFHRDFSSSELKEQATALAIWLENRKDAPDEEEHHGETIREIRNLSILLNWAVGHGLGTDASY